MEAKRKLLIVEDDPETIKFYDLFFKKYYDVDICSKSTEFFELVNSKKYDCILMDIALSDEVSGLDIITKLKNDSNYSKIPIICVTAHVKSSDKQNAMIAGADLFVAKPIHPRELLARINTIIGEKQTS